MPRNISLMQILIVVLIIVLLFGARRLPDLAASIGKSLKIFKKEVTELRDDDADEASGQRSAGISSDAASTPAPPPVATSPAASPPDAAATGTGQPGPDRPSGTDDRP